MKQSRDMSFYRESEKSQKREKRLKDDDTKRRDSRVFVSRSSILIFLLVEEEKKIDKSNDSWKIDKNFLRRFGVIVILQKKKKMAVSFPRLPRWLCGGNSKDREKKESNSKGSLNPSPKKTRSASVKKIKRGGWIGSGRGGEEDKMGNVVFPEPDEPEWSIGWVEPHGPGLKVDDDDDCGGFVVLVPCYKKVMNGSGNQIPNGFFSPAPDGKNMEQWLSSMGKL